MTLEELLEYPAEKLEALSDKELTDYFMPFFPTTRPELQVNKAAPMKNKQEDMELKIKLQKARLIAKSFGIDLK